MLDELGAECAHRRVFLSRVAVRHYNRHSNAGVRSGESQRLAVVTARGGHDPLHLRSRALESVKIDNAAAQLEGTYGRVVLVLHYDFHTGQRLEQRPSILWRRRDDRANQRNHVVELSKCKHLGSSHPGTLSCFSWPVEARDARIAHLILEQQVIIPTFRTIIMETHGMKLYAYWRSQASFRVRIALRLKGLVAETTSLDLLKGDQFDPSYRMLNPEMVVPTLLDGEGPPLVQSLAILEYLEEKYPQSPILPVDLRARAHVRGLAQMLAMDAHPFIVPRVRKYLEQELHLDEPARMKWLRHWLDTGSRGRRRTGSRPAHGALLLRRSTDYRRYLSSRTSDQCQNAM
jgi:glutathione S-transferase